MCVNKCSKSANRKLLKMHTKLQTLPAFF